LRNSNGSISKPSFIVEGKNYNSSIINFEPPEYGDGMPGGCIVDWEFKVRVDSLQRDGQSFYFTGNITAVDNNEILPGVILKILDQSENEISETRTDDLGNFSISTKNEEGLLLQLNYIGFRSIRVRLNEIFETN
jgi:hypothetical protein